MVSSLAYSLVQHSPLLHYQGNQPGAFLSDAALKAAIDWEMNNGLIKGNRKKIRYSLYTEPQGMLEKKQYTEALRGNSLYFGDIGDRPQSYLIFTESPIKLNISDYMKEVDVDSGEIVFEESIFANNLLKTLAFNNFGKRGSKGFGCFWPDCKISLESYLRSKLPEGYGLYKINVNLKDNKDNWTLFKNCYNYIDAYYKNLKSGINWPDPDDPKKPKLYAKSILMQYLKDRNITWDKKQIKDKFLNNSIPENPLMERFQLGFGQLHEYRRKYHQAHGYDSHSAFKVVYDILKSETLTDSDIKRIPSPITFKIVYHDVHSADILFFVNPFVEISEYKDLQNLTIRAKTKINSTNMDLDLALISLNTLDLNEMLNFAKTRFMTGVQNNANNPIIPRLTYINQHLKRVR